MSQEWRNYIPSGGMNDVVADWHSHQLPREQSVASPSSLMECPRVVWLKKHEAPFTNVMGWGRKQRMMLGRITENLFAKQLKDEGKLLYHWKDDAVGESVKFGMGEGLGRIEGTPDLLINLDGVVLISDAKTSRADSFAYVPIDNPWEDELWYKYKLQVECYYLLAHKNKEWFTTGPVVTTLENSSEVYTRTPLPLPEACHLFSYALDDGVVKREYTWKPTQKVAAEIIYYTNRWNKAYQSVEIPACQCTPTQVKFCPYASEMETTRNGYKLGIRCCDDII